MPAPAKAKVEDCSLTRHRYRAPMLFEKMTMLQDPVPHGAALNMALDEVLLRMATGPLLRIYDWERPAISLGYFEKIAEIEPYASRRELVRRWTGGGVVFHGEDVTYTLVVPTGCAFAQMSARDSYRQIHECVAGALRVGGVQTELATQAAAKISSGCFENAAEADILDGDRKIAGAAQRRTRAGLLHQGSIQTSSDRSGLTARLIAAFASSVDERAFTTDELTQAAQLSADKYGTEPWLRRF